MAKPSLQLLSLPCFYIPVTKGTNGGAVSKPYQEGQRRGYTKSNEYTLSKIHICIWRKSNVISPLWKDWFWLCPTFIQRTAWHRVDRGRKQTPKKPPKHQKTTNNPLELSVTMGKSITKAVFNKLSVLLQSFPTRSISITAHFLFTIPRESLWLLHYLVKQFEVK